MLGGFKFADLTRMPDVTLAEGEARGEILDILRRRHHDPLGAAFEDHGNRQLFGQAAQHPALPVTLDGQAGQALA